jgi:hypothetical protein
MTPITATSRPFVPAPGQGLPLHNTCILASSEIYHCTTCIHAVVRKKRPDEFKALLTLNEALTEPIVSKPCESAVHQQEYAGHHDQNLTYSTCS